MSALTRGLRAGTLLRGARGDALALVAGLPLVLGFAPFGWYGIPLVSFAGLLICLEGVTPRRALWRGYLFGVGAFLAGLYWIHISIHVFGGAPLPLALGLMVLLVLFLAIYPAVFAGVLNRLFPDSTLARYVLAAPAIWVLVEWLRGWLFSGFGWLGVGYTQSDGPLSHWLAVLGVYGSSLAVLMLAGGIAASLLMTRNRVWAWLPGVAAVAGGLSFGAVEWTEPTDQTVDVALVQGSVPQELKWIPDQLQPTVDLYVGLTDQHLDADLVVWPEAAIPTARRNLDGLFDALRARGAKSDTEFLIGTVAVDPVSLDPVNTAIILGATAAEETRYVKRHLVPYGEYFPVPGFVRRIIQWMNLPYQDFQAGGDDQPPLEAAGVSIAMSICYEDVFGAELRAMLPEATVLANVSNDAWFGGSVAPHQHLQMARVRAIETGRMMLRGTNNGISAIIDQNGRVVARSGQFEPEVLRGRVTGYTGATPFVRFGNVPTVVGCLALIALGLALHRPR